MISYLIKSGLCLAILLAFYYLVLEREKMHQFNRFYLLGSILFSFIVPFIIIYVEATPVIVDTVNTIATTESHNILLEEQPIKESISFTQYFLIFYLFISSLLLVRFIKSLVDIFLKIKYNEVTSYQNAKVVLVNDKILPHTFWNYIFINKEDFEEQKIESELFTHELAHVTQRHTIDVLIVELIQIVLWFNPFFYPLKKAIQLNHEFLADDNVIASHQDIPKYQYLLLDKATWKNKYYLASNLNYSLTKKRLLMMKTQNSKSTILLKKLAIVPLLGGLVFLFADRVEAQTKEKTPEIIEVQEVSSEASLEQMKTYKYLLKVTDNTNLVDMEDVETMRRIRSIMSEEQKNSVPDFKKVVPPPPLRAPKKINAEKYKKLKDAEKYAVWVDNKPIKNSELNKHSHTDFYSYVVSFIHENARSKKYPQTYQVTLYTEKYYKSLEPDEAVNNLARVVKKNSNPNGPYPISAVTFEKIKNSKLYVVKIDGKKVKNSTLNNYSAKDFYSHTVLRVMPNEKVPHPKVHYDLMTKSYYLKNKKKYEKLSPPPPKPIKIEVVKKEKNNASKGKKLKEVKAKKAPKKKVKIRETLSPKGSLEIKEEIEEEEEKGEEIEVREKIEIKEVPEGVEEEEIEIREAPYTEEEEEVEIHRERKHKERKHEEHKYEEKHKERKHAEHFKEDYKSLVKEGAKFYLNGKKVSAKKIKKYFFEKKDDVQTIDVIKSKKGTKVKLKIK